MPPPVENARSIPEDKSPLRTQLINKASSVLASDGANQQSTNIAFINKDQSHYDSTSFSQIEQYNKDTMVKTGKKGETMPLTKYLRNNSLELVKIAISSQLDGWPGNKRELIAKYKEDWKAMGINVDVAANGQITVSEKSLPKIETDKKAEDDERQTNRFAFVLSALAASSNPGSDGVPALSLVSDITQVAETGKRQTQKTVDTYLTKIGGKLAVANPTINNPTLLQAVRQTLVECSLEAQSSQKVKMEATLENELAKARIASLKIAERVKPAPKYGEQKIASGTAAIGLHLIATGEQNLLNEEHDGKTRVGQLNLMDIVAARYGAVYLPTDEIVAEQKSLKKEEEIRVKIAAQLQKPLVTRNADGFYDHTLEYAVRDQQRELLTKQYARQEQKQLMMLIMLEQKGVDLTQQYKDDPQMTAYIGRLKSNARYNEFREKVAKRIKQIETRQTTLGQVQPTLMKDFLVKISEGSSAPKKTEAINKIVAALEGPIKPDFEKALANLGLSDEDATLVRKYFEARHDDRRRELTEEGRLQHGYAKVQPKTGEMTPHTADDGLFNRLGLRFNEPTVKGMKALDDFLVKGSKMIVEGTAKNPLGPTEQEQLREEIRVTDGTGRQLTHEKLETAGSQRPIVVTEKDGVLVYSEKQEDVAAASNVATQPQTPTESVVGFSQDQTTGIQTTAHAPTPVAPTEVPAAVETTVAPAAERVAQVEKTTEELLQQALAEQTNNQGATSAVEVGTPAKTEVENLQELLSRLTADQTNNEPVTPNTTLSTGFDADQIATTSLDAMQAAILIEDESAQTAACQAIQNALLKKAQIDPSTYPQNLEGTQLHDWLIENRMDPGDADKVVALREFAATLQPPAKVEEPGSVVHVENFMKIVTEAFNVDAANSPFPIEMVAAEATVTVPYGAVVPIAENQGKVETNGHSIISINAENAKVKCENPGATTVINNKGTMSITPNAPALVLENHGTVRVATADSKSILILPENFDRSQGTIDMAVGISAYHLQSKIPAPTDLEPGTQSSLLADPNTHTDGRHIFMNATNTDGNKILVVLERLQVEADQTPNGQPIDVLFLRAAGTKDDLLKQNFDANTLAVVEAKFSAPPASSESENHASADTPPFDQPGWQKIDHVDYQNATEPINKADVVLMDILEKNRIKIDAADPIGKRAKAIQEYFNGTDWNGDANLPNIAACKMFAISNPGNFCLVWGIDRAELDAVSTRDEQLDVFVRKTIATGFARQTFNDYINPRVESKTIELAWPTIYKELVEAFPQQKALITEDLLRKKLIDIPNDTSPEYAILQHYLELRKQHEGTITGTYQEAQKQVIAEDNNQQVLDELIAQMQAAFKKTETRDYKTLLEPDRPENTGLSTPSLIGRQYDDPLTPLLFQSPELVRTLDEHLKTIKGKGLLGSNIGQANYYKLMQEGKSKKVEDQEYKKQWRLAEAIRIALAEKTYTEFVSHNFDTDVKLATAAQMETTQLNTQTTELARKYARSVQAQIQERDFDPEALISLQPLDIVVYWAAYDKIQGIDDVMSGIRSIGKETTVSDMTGQILPIANGLANHIVQSLTQYSADQIQKDMVLNAIQQNMAREIFQTLYLNRIVNNHY